jgi:hypothetical protein
MPAQVCAPWGGRTPAQVYAPGGGVRSPAQVCALGGGTPAQVCAPAGVCEHWSESGEPADSTARTSPDYVPIWQPLLSPQPLSRLGSPCPVTFQQNWAWCPTRAWEGRQARAGSPGNLCGLTWPIWHRVLAFAEFSICPVTWRAPCQPAHLGQLPYPQSVRDSMLPGGGFFWALSQPRIS